jgi:hypothetical protein
MDPTSVLKLVREQNRQINDNHIVNLNEKILYIPPKQSDFSQMATYFYANYNRERLNNLNNEDIIYTYTQNSSNRLPRQNFKTQISTLNNTHRSGSTKSIASDSGLSSISPFSDCSDLNNNVLLINNQISPSNVLSISHQQKQDTYSLPLVNNTLIVPKCVDSIENVKVLTKIELTEEQKKRLPKFENVSFAKRKLQNNINQVKYCIKIYIYLVFF